MVNLTFVEAEEYKKQTEKGTLVVSYGYPESPFGTCLIGTVGDKICHLSFVEKESRNLEELKKEWQGAVFEKDEEKTASTARQVFDGDKKRLEVLCKGTEFQGSVWRELLKIPEGKTWSYEELAKNCGKPKGARACARAVATNCVAYLIPCHRVIKKSGGIHRYRWGCLIKEKILAAEKKKEGASGPC